MFLHKSGGTTYCLTFRSVTRSGTASAGPSIPPRGLPCLNAASSAAAIYGYKKEIYKNKINKRNKQTKKNKQNKQNKKELKKKSIFMQYNKIQRKVKNSEKKSKKIKLTVDTF